jgi:hypothetical protein
MAYGDDYDNATADAWKGAGDETVALGMPKEKINIGVGTYSSGGEWCQADAG